MKFHSQLLPYSIYISRLERQITFCKLKHNNWFVSQSSNCSKVFEDCGFDVFITERYFISEFIENPQQIDLIESQAPEDYHNEDYCHSVMDFVDHDFEVDFFKTNWLRRENCTFQNAMEIQLEIERKCSQLLSFSRYADVDEKCTNFTKAVSKNLENYY